MKYFLNTFPFLSILLTVLYSDLNIVSAQIGPGNRGNVSKSFICTRDGSNYILRSRPSQKSKSKILIPPGRQVVLLDSSKVTDGFTWHKINFLGATGWIRGDYLCD
jgi:Bacterial SH3 domain